MKIKRTEFTTTFVVIALMAVTAGVQLLSAFGAICVAWNDFFLLGDADPGTIYFPGKSYQYVIDNLLLFRMSNIITWIGAFFWGYIIFSVLTQKKGAYLMALITSALSFVMGLIPALIADISAMKATAVFLGADPVYVLGVTPHWARTFANFMVLIVLLIPPVRKSIMNFTSSESLMVGKVAQQIMMMSLFFFWLSLVSFLGTSFMAEAHLAQGVVAEVVAAQSIGGFATAIVGVSMLGGGFILKQFKPSNSLITSMEANH